MAGIGFVPILFGEKMIDPNDIVGKKFSMLTVEKYDGIRTSSNRKKHFYVCKCECGVYNTVGRDTLIGFGTKSCGCLNHKKGSDNRGWKGVGEISGYYWSRLRCGAIHRNIKFEVDIEYAWELWESQNGRCALTNLPICLLEDKKSEHNRTASLDRIDNSIGYTRGNIQWVHKDINRIKSNLSQDRFIELCFLIEKTREKKNEYRS